jgi:hypothetical protein
VYARQTSCLFAIDFQTTTVVTVSFCNHSITLLLLKQLLVLGEIEQAGRPGQFLATQINMWYHGGSVGSRYGLAGGGGGYKCKECKRFEFYNSFHLSPVPFIPFIPCIQPAKVQCRRHRPPRLFWTWQPDRTCSLARLFKLCITYSSLCVSTGGARAPSTGVAFRPYHQDSQRPGDGAGAHWRIGVCWMPLFVGRLYGNVAKRLPDPVVHWLAHIPDLV